MTMNLEAPILILAESNYRSPSPEEVPAWQRFTGPVWKDIRKKLPREAIENHIYVMTSFSGLVQATELIPQEYEKMNQRRSIQLYEQINNKVAELLEAHPNPIEIVLTEKYLSLLGEDFISHGRVTLQRNQFFGQRQLVSDVIGNIAKHYPGVEPAGTLGRPQKQLVSQASLPLLSISEIKFGGYMIYSLPAYANVELFQERFLEHAGIELEVGLPPILEGVIDAPPFPVLYQVKED